MKTKIKTPISLSFTYTDDEWRCLWNDLFLRLCGSSVAKFVPNHDPCTLILRKTPSEGFQRVRFWLESQYWCHDQWSIIDNRTFFGKGIDTFLTNLSEGKTEMFFYFKFVQK